MSKIPQSRSPFRFRMPLAVVGVLLVNSASAQLDWRKLAPVTTPPGKIWST